MNRFKILSIIASIVLFIVATSSAQADTLTTYGDATVTTGANGTGWTLTSDNTGNGYSGIRVTVTNPLTVSSLTQLSASYQTLQGTFHGGAPRFGLRDSLGNQAWIYWGTPTGGGSFSDPLAGAYGSTGNYASLVSPDFRVYSNNFGGFNQPNTGVTWAVFSAAVPSELITRIYVDVDGGWGGAQQVFVNGLQINNDVYGPSEVPEPASMVLLGTGITGLVAGARKRRKQQAAKAE